MTQPSVSAAVAALERELGVPLTERAGRTLRPTPAGAAYAPYAADVLGLLEQGTRAAREAADRGRRTLRISAVTTAGEFLLPPLIQGFRENFPDLEISLDVGNRADVFQRLADHDVDVAITGRVPEDGRLVGRPFMDNEWVLITAPGDALSKRRWVAMEELAGRGRGSSVSPGSGTRDPVRGLPRRPRHPPARADARLQRRDQAGGAGRSRCRVAVAGGGRAGARGSGCSRRSARAAGCRTAPGTSCARRPARCATSSTRSWRTSSRPRPGTPSLARGTPGPSGPRRRAATEAPRPRPGRRRTGIGACPTKAGRNMHHSLVRICPASCRVGAFAPVVR